MTIFLRLPKLKNKVNGPSLPDFSFHGVYLGVHGRGSLSSPLQSDREISCTRGWDHALSARFHSQVSDRLNTRLSVHFTDSGTKVLKTILKPWLVQQINVSKQTKNNPMFTFKRHLKSKCILSVLEQPCVDRIPFIMELVSAKHWCYRDPWHLRI